MPSYFKLHICLSICLFVQLFAYMFICGFYNQLQFLQSYHNMYSRPRLHTLKLVQKPWALSSKQIRSRSFKWGTKHWFWSRGCKDIRGQSWRTKKISAEWPGSNPCACGRPRWQIFFSSSNFDLWYLCSLLTKINVWYLIWKIYLVFVWRTKSKAFERVLRYVILAQGNPISIGLM